MGYLDGAFLLPQASFSTTLLTNCGTGGCPGTITFLNTVVLGRQGHAPCKIL